MAFVRAPENGFSRIMLSWLVLLAIDFPCKCFSVGSPTINVQDLFLCRVLGLLCSVISSRSDFLSTWSRGSLSLVLLLEFLFAWGSCHKSYYLTDWYWALVVLIIFFFTSYYGAVIATCCGFHYIIYSLLVGLGANFGVFGCYNKNVQVHDLKSCPIKC